jgi:hypothetical protein
MTHLLVTLVLGLLPAVQEQEAPSPEEAARMRREAAQESERALHGEAIAKLGDEWTSFETEHLLVLSHTDEKKARRVVAQVEAVLAFVQQELGMLGEGEYMRRPILRVCRDEEERRSLTRQRSTTPTWLPAGLEILGSADTEGPGSFSLASLNSLLLQHFLKERATETYLAMPPWLGHGLQRYVEGLRLDKYGKLQFYLDDWDRDDLTVQTQLGRGLPPAQLFRMTEKKIGGGETRGKYAQTDALVRFLLSEEGKKNPRAKSLLASYLAALQTIANEKSAEMRARAETMQAEDAKKPADGDETEAGENGDAKAPVLDPEQELARWRRKAWLDSEETLIEDLWFQNFRSFEDKDWKSLEKSFAKFID